MAEMMPSAQLDGKFAGVQAARGIAAMAVVLYHATRSLSLPQYLGQIPFGNIFGFGHAGVDFFFVLSGFIITHAHAADVGNPRQLGRYLWRRFSRIYPIYWFVFIIEAGRAIFSPDVLTRLAPWHVLCSVPLLPESVEPLVNVAWTLRFEVLFYLIFGLTIVDRRFSKPVVAAAVALVLIGTIAAPANPWLSMMVSPFNILFLMGISTARVVARRRIPGPAVLVIAGTFCFLATGTAEVMGTIPLEGLAGRLCYGISSLIGLLGLIELERQGNLRIAMIGVLAGNASYCLYLIHLTIIPTAVRALAYVGLLATLPVSLTIALMMSTCLVVALALHQVVELPLMNALRAHTPRVLR